MLFFQACSTGDKRPREAERFQTFERDALHDKKFVKRKISRSFASKEEILLYDNIDNFNIDVEKMLVWRSKALSFLEDLSSADILTSDQITKLHENGTKEYFTLTRAFVNAIEDIKWTTDSYNTLIVTKDRKTEIEKKITYRTIGGKKREVVKYKIYVNPLDAPGMLLIKKIKYALASSMVLYDNYIIVLSQYAKLRKIRHIINYDNDEKKYGLTGLTKQFNSVKYYNRAEKAFVFYEKVREFEQQHDLVMDQDHSFLEKVIQSSLSYHEMKRLVKKSIWRRKLRFAGNFVKDYLVEAKNNVMNLLSKIFGNTVGLVQFREGKLKNKSDEWIENIQAKLKPLDILFEKTPFRLTDRFIPGHWGHVAIWSGSKEQLVKMGLWDHPIIKPYQDDIEFKNKRVIEALRPGVQINTLRHFLDIDDLAVVRYESMDPEDAKKYLTNAFKQIGKDYDFNFNVETDERIVCSELAYVTFSDLTWPTEYTLGRYNISPDHVANKVSEENVFKPVLLIHDGRDIRSDLFTNFRRLLHGEYSDVTF